ncbi:MAG: acyl-CoA thioesterase [Alphaproteobacteria bacterium]|nr:acyl-CoA thioesterase [Alphaproteobacteria bacterium]
MTEPSAQPREIFTLPLTIAPADIDELGHVNNGVYLRWAQDIATTHWRTRAGADLVAAYVWVLSRCEIDYRAELKLGDAVEARTWVADAARGAAWDRFVEIWRTGDAKPAAEIKMIWALLDGQTRRLKRVPAEIIQRFTA